MRPFLLAHLLTMGAQAAPDRDALELPEGVLSYGELDTLSDRLAASLRAAGVGHHDRVGIYLPKGREAYVALLAVLKTGAAYVPLDAAAPAERIRKILADCGLEVVIAAAEHLPELAGVRLAVAVGAAGAGVDAGVEVVAWDDALAAGRPPLPNPAIESDLAYVLYTSGSTGLPKGVMVSHRNALAFAEWAAATFELSGDDRVAAVAELHFDLSILDLFATLAAGATVVPLPPGSLLRPRQAASWIARNEITVWYSTPSTLILLLEEGELASQDLSRLRHVLFAGEVFPTKHLRRLRRILPAAELHNLYGPTETNVCLWKRVDEVPADDRRTVPIGRPCANTQVVALDDAGGVAAVGEEGELWVRGPTVMRGYWGDAAKSGSVLRPLAGLTPWDDVWYRTGDLVHLDETGDYHFHGRRDHMVKVRGYRVEIGEVEAALYSHEDVRELAVVAVAGEDGRAKLRAYVVPADPDGFSPIRLKAHAGERLPAYMIPAEMRAVSHLPKTSTGKVDRRRLAAGELSNGEQEP